MDSSILEDLKNRLKERRTGIIKQLESIGHRAEGKPDDYDADFPNYGESMEDNATEVADYSTNFSLEKKLEEERYNIDEALAKMAEDKYGVCDRCQKEIELEVLKISPESILCLACKKALNREK